jgi:hypothetical protein
MKKEERDLKESIFALNFLLKLPNCINPSQSKEKSFKSFCLFVLNLLYLCFKDFFILEISELNHLCRFLLHIYKKTLHIKNSRKEDKIEIQNKTNKTNLSFILFIHSHH